MKCPECGYYSKKKPIKCTICGNVFKSTTITRFDSIDDPGFVMPIFDTTPKPCVFTPTEIMVDYADAPSKKRGGFFDGIFGSFMNGVFGDVFDANDNDMYNSKYSAVLDDYGNTLSKESLTSHYTVIDDYNEHKE